MVSMVCPLPSCVIFPRSAPAILAAVTASFTSWARRKSAPDKAAAVWAARVGASLSSRARGALSPPPPRAVTRLPGGPHQQGAAPHPQAAGVGQQGQVFLIVGAKAHAPRSKHSCSWEKPSRAASSQAGLGKTFLVAASTSLPPWPPQGADYHAAAAGACRRPEHLLPKAGDIVDDVGPGSQGLFRHLGVEGVHRQRRVQLPEKQGQHVFEGDSTPPARAQP